MKHMFLLSGENIDLAKEEAVNLLDIKNIELNGRLLITDKIKNKGMINRLAYTKKIYECLFECRHEEIFDFMENFNWQSVYDGSFVLRFVNEENKRISFEEKHLASHIWNNVKRPRVNLKNPKTQIELIFTPDKIYCGKLVYKNKEKFEKRKPYLRPGFHPSSLHPKLARAAINLAGAKGAVTDPFCGTGGILIEAGLMGLPVTGFDISLEMLDKCEKNLKHYKINNYLLMDKNALHINHDLDYVITDLPYGKSTKAGDIERLYENFLVKLKNKLKGNAVVIFPSFVNHKKIIKNSGLKIEKELDYYVHKSLSKKIVLLGM